MFVRLVIPAIVVFGAAWVLVQPDTPEPQGVAASAVGAAVATDATPGSAIELLGETWSAEAPAPIVRPLTAAENAAAIAAMQRPDLRAPARSDEVALAEPLRRPVPRPVTYAPWDQAVDRGDVRATQPQPERAAELGTDRLVVISQDPGVTAAPPPVIALRGAVDSAVARADAERRWVVRRQGTGDVVAEVSLAEALAILTSR
jgi:hypothetical protein